jgi:hypothetical protein
MPSLTPEIIQAAIDGFEAQKKHIDATIDELRGMLTNAPAVSTTKSLTGKGRRKMSPATLQRMREGQQRRWAAAKGKSVSQAEAPASKPKRKLSAAGRKAISEATKKRWAAKRAAKAS